METTQESATLQEAIRYYADLEAATKVFSAPYQSAFRVPGIAAWSIWTRRKI
jgi:hypothetical protein